MHRQYNVSILQAQQNFAINGRAAERRFGGNGRTTFAAIRGRPHFADARRFGKNLNLALSAPLKQKSQGIFIILAFGKRMTTLLIFPLSDKIKI